MAISWNPIINLENFDANSSSNPSYFPNILHSTINNMMKDVKNVNKKFFLQSLPLKSGKKLKYSL